MANAPTTLPEVTVTASRIPPAPYKQVVSDPFAMLTCSVEVYPFEGGPYVITGGQLRSVTVTKSLGDAGSFTLELAPGGPQGAESPKTWSQTITPMSHVLIGMARGAESAVIMDGIVTEPAESQVWQTGNDGSTAGRDQIIHGNDFGWFFKSFNFFALSFMGIVAGTGLNNALKYAPVGLIPLLSKGLVGGTDPQKSNPVETGKVWFKEVMAGDHGILNNTSVPYKSESRVTFTKAMSAIWEKYPDVFIPLSSYFMVSEENWIEKFYKIFPAPWYEFFVTTSPDGFYSLNSSGALEEEGTLFTMDSMPKETPAAGPILVARINPTPTFGLVNTAGKVAPGSMDVKRWTELPLIDFTKYGFGFLNSTISFSATGAKNFYQLNPTFYGTMLGLNNATNIPSYFSFMAAADPASIQRYGFRPQAGTTEWMFDAGGTAAQNTSIDVNQTILSLIARLVSWHHPTPLMARSTVTIPLAPRMMVGARFRYAPFKDGVPWDFYIEAFEHHFVFGGHSQTRLSLSRGLPASVYGDVKDDGLLRAIHIGNAMKKNGEYVVGLPDKSEVPLTFIVTQEQAASLNQHLIEKYTTPQAMDPPHSP